MVDEWFRDSGAQVSGYSFPAWPTTLPDLSMQVLPPLNWNLTVTVRDFPAFQKWLLKLPRAPRFMAMSGLAPDDLRAQAADPHFLSGVLDFMLQDESLVVGFAAGAGMKPDAVMRARQAFGGMEGVEW